MDASTFRLLGSRAFHMLADYISSKAVECLDWKSSRILVQTVYLTRRKAIPNDNEGFQSTSIKADTLKTARPTPVGP